MLFFRSLVILWCIAIVLCLYLNFSHFSQVASYMKEVNNIFHKAEFDGIDVVNFKVKSMKVRFLLMFISQKST